MEVSERFWTVKDERMQSANRVQSEYMNTWWAHGERTEKSESRTFQGLYEISINNIH